MQWQTNARQLTKLASPLQSMSCLFDACAKVRYFAMHLPILYLHRGLHLTFASRYKAVRLEAAVALPLHKSPMQASRLNDLPS